MPGTPNGIGSWGAALFAIEALVVMGEFQEATVMYPLLQAAIRECNYRIRYPDCRSTHLLAAIAASTGGAWAQAGEHFRIGRADAERHGRRSLADCDYFESWAPAAG